MATFFGEVVLPSSRAFWEEEDESDEEEEVEGAARSLQETVFASPQRPLSTSSHEYLVITDGDIARAFGSIYLKGASCTSLATYCLPNSEEGEFNYTLGLKTAPTRPTTVFETSADCFLVECSPLHDLIWANQLTSSVSKWLLASKKILILSSCHVANYKCDTPEELPMSFLKCLYTTKHEKTHYIEPLEQPNFLTGFSASVLSWCEIMKKDCCLFVCYTDSTDVDSISLGAYKSLFTTAFPSIVRTPNYSVIKPKMKSNMFL